MQHHQAIAVYFTDIQSSAAMQQERADEFCALIRSAAVNLLQLVRITMRRKVYPRFFVSEHKLALIQDILEQYRLAYMDH